MAYAKWKYEKAGVDLAAAMAETDVWLKGLTPLLQVRGRSPHTVGHCFPPLLGSRGACRCCG